MNLAVPVLQETEWRLHLAYMHCHGISSPPVSSCQVWPTCHKYLASRANYVRNVWHDCAILFFEFQAGRMLLQSHTIQLRTTCSQAFSTLYSCSNPSTAIQCIVYLNIFLKFVILTTRFIPVCSPHSLDSNMVQYRALICSHCLHILQKNWVYIAVDKWVIRSLVLFSILPHN